MQRWGGRTSRTIAASLLFHTVLLLVLLHRTRVWVAPVRMPGTTQGTRLVLTYVPGPAVSALHAEARAMTRPRAVAPRPHTISRVLPPAAAVAVAAETPQAASSGMSALGEGDISIALMQFFPDPRPDLSRLPHGSRGDVVLEAVIDTSGRIAQLTVKQGVGYGVDESVIATVQQWIFHPAMRDGKPVASQQEFHFHYERG